MRFMAGWLQLGGAPPGIVARYAVEDARRDAMPRVACGCSSSDREVVVRKVQSAIEPAGAAQRRASRRPRSVPGGV
jgi:hypothetical protein